MKVLLMNFIVSHQFSSVQLSHSVMSDSLRPHKLQHARPPYPSPTPGVGDGQGGLAYCNSWGRKESDTTADPCTGSTVLILAPPGGPLRVDF